MGRVTKATWVSAGLFLAWAVHDAEELVTAAASSRELVRRAPTWLPLPADLRRDGFSQHHMNVAIAPRFIRSSGWNSAPPATDQPVEMH